MEFPLKMVRMELLFRRFNHKYLKHHDDQTEIKVRILHGNERNAQVI